MSKNRRPLAILFMAPIALAAIVLTHQTHAQKPTVVSSVNRPLTLSLSSSAKAVSACTEAGGPKVQLTANAVSPDGNPIKYRWTTSGGVITGDGPTVTWDLTGLKPGYHKASLDIQSSGTEGECHAFSSVSVLVNPCPVIPPVCPTIEIVCPTNIGIDQPLTFTSRYTGGTPAITPAYNWTVSAGTIMEGQGTNTIKVNTTGLAGQTVRASLSMAGYGSLMCSADCGVSIPVPRIVSRRFDEFPDIQRNDEKARLDNFVIELQNDPTATAYVVIYPGRGGKRGDVQHHATRIVDYMVNSRGIDQHRIVTLVGAARDELFVELWITPQGATPPNP
ncbi:MAG TPA: hypothetical protein VFO99_15035 [Pyrinomonadaceae bacterium]|nr:hypothetical protein [Pyrinomonadaceae bacterium]